LGKSFLNTFLTPTAHLLINRLVGVASLCGHERAQFDSTGGWLWPAAGRTSTPPPFFHFLGALASRRLVALRQTVPRRRDVGVPKARNLKTKSMIDFIFIAVIALFFVASGFYARWCGKL
jgi:hypothetical protein